MNDQEQPTLAGVGPVAYICLKEDLEPDTLTPREGKQWTKVESATPIWLDKESADIEKEKHGFKQSFQQSFTMEYKPNRRIQSLVKRSEENVVDCGNLLRAKKPRLFLRKRIIRNALRKSRGILEGLTAYPRNWERSLAEENVKAHINHFRLLLGKKVLAAWTVDPDTKEPYLIYSRYHNGKVIDLARKHNNKKL